MFSNIFDLYLKNFNDRSLKFTIYSVAFELHSQIKQHINTERKTRKNFAFVEVYVHIKLILDV